MHNRLQGIRLALIGLIAIGTLSGLFAAYRRFHVEEANRRVEIGLEWQEVALLAQSSNQPVAHVLESFKQQHVTTIILAEDTITTLEQSGAVRPSRATLPNGQAGTVAVVDSLATLDRTGSALRLRGLSPSGAGNETRTSFQFNGRAPSAPDSPRNGVPQTISVPVDYVNLRTMGVGLPPEAIETVKTAGMRIAGRIGNFPGVNENSARAALESLRDQGASTVIFTGEEVLGYRGPVEKAVAGLLRDPNAAAHASLQDEIDVTPYKNNPLPVYGAVEFGKQKGDEKLSIALKGDYVRVHSIQTAELGQMEEEEAVDRFVKAAKERNIRFCYVRLLTFAGQDPVAENVKFLNKISRGMAHGHALMGGGMAFGAARRYAETGVSSLLFGIIALGAAAGIVWMLYVLCPLPARSQWLLLIILSLICFATAFGLGETGRKLVAFAVGITYPTVACLITFPQNRSRCRPDGSPDSPSSDASECAILSPTASLIRAIRAIGLASLVTTLGIIQVVGLLATRPFMLRANQFLGIKAQHAVPILIIALVAILGGVTFPGETWERFKARAAGEFRRAMDEPARFGLLILGIVALAGLALVVARTGNDAGVGVSGTELKIRAVLDRVLPVRPRTKEFLVGHPAYVLALAWWWRGRRRLAIPTFVVGCLGQVSLLNTFCHIHTPLIVSVWRDGLGLLFGILIGAAIFLALEFVLSRARKEALP